MTPTARLGAIFAPDTPMDYAEDMMSRMQGTADPNFPAFNLNSRWTRTATQSGPLSQGDATTIRWGFVRDGLSLPSGAGEPATASNLISLLDARFGAGPGGSDFTQRPWFGSFSAIFDRMAALSGNTYVYEANDDAAPFTASSVGVIGVRGDVRIGAHPIDGPSGILAFNAYPNYGEMTIDSNDLAAGEFYDDPTSNYLALRNVLAHEHGHGIGIEHEMPIIGAALMEPFVNLSFDGPQLDDVLALQRHYGDALEKNGGNDTLATAFPFGAIPDNGSKEMGLEGDVSTQFIDPAWIDFLSIDGSSDTDVYSFTVPAGSLISLTVEPLGISYRSGVQGGPPPTIFDALRQNNLVLELMDASGTVIQSANVNGLGGSEQILDVSSASGGTYYARVTGTLNAVQLYRLSVSDQIVTIVPTITRNAGQLTPTRTNPLRFDVNFSRPVTGFDASDIQFTAGTITTGMFAFVTPNGSTGSSYFVDIFGTSGQGTVGIAIPAGAAFNPSLGASSTAATTPSGDLISFDNVSPAPFFAPAPIGLTNATSIPQTVDFGEPVTGFDRFDLQLTNATVSGFSAVSASVYQFLLLPTASGAFSVTIPAGVATDSVGNVNVSATNSGTLDRIAPLAAVTRVTTSPTNGSPAVFEVVFSEPVQLPFTTSFVGSTVGGTLNPNITPEPGIPYAYLVSITGMTGEGLIYLTVPAGGASDIAGNTLTADAVTNSPVVYDPVPPDVTVTIPGSGVSNLTDLPVTIAFSERVTGFNLLDIQISGSGTKSNLVADPDGMTFTFTVTRQSDGPFTIDIPASAATDLAGNTSTTGSATGEFDTVSPVASVVRVSAPQLISGPAVFRVVFNEPVATPFTVSFAGSTVGGTLAAAIAPDTDPLSPPNSYLVSVTGMDGEGTVRVSVLAGDATDLAGNPTVAGAVADADVYFDNLAPSVVLSSSSSLTTNANTIPVTVAFSETVKGFAAADIQTTGPVLLGDFLALSDGRTFTFNLSRTADGSFTVTIPAGSVTDLPGNPNSDGLVAGTFDTTKPTVTVVPTTPTFTDADVVFRVTFNEPLQAGTSFTLQDLVFGGSAHAKTAVIAAGATPQIFTVTVTGMTRSGVVTAQVLGAAASDAAGNTSNASAGATADYVTTATPPTNLVGTREYVAGTDGGSEALAQLFNPDGSARFTTTAFDGAGAGGVRTAAGDFTLDGVADLVISSGPGVPSLVQVIDGATGKELMRIRPFEPTFIGGTFVAVGDITSDGTPEIVITPDQGGGPRVQVYRGVDLLKIADFFGIADTSFRGGARAAVGDVNGDDIGDLLVAAGFGGGPRVAGFDGAALAAGRLSHMFPDFFVFEQALRNGAFVAAGDVNGDGFADMIAGGGPGGAPRVLIIDGNDLVTKKNRSPGVIANFYAGDIDNRDGIRVSAKNLDDDGNADVVVGAGSGTQLTAFYGKVLSGGSTTQAYAFDAFPEMEGGVFVG